MEEEEFEVLRRWGDALVDDQRAEVRAAGRAILMLSSEIERLQVELWHARLGVDQGAAEDAALADTPAESNREPELTSTLRRVIQAARLRTPGLDNRPKND